MLNLCEARLYNTIVIVLNSQEHDTSAALCLAAVIPYQVWAHLWLFPIEMWKTQSELKWAPRQRLLWANFEWVVCLDWSQQYSRCTVRWSSTYQDNWNNTKARCLYLQHFCSGKLEVHLKIQLLTQNDDNLPRVSSFHCHYTFCFLFVPGRNSFHLLLASNKLDGRAELVAP